MTRRPAGAGSVDQLPSGKWRARVTLSDDSRRSIGTFGTEADAWAALDAALRELASGNVAPVGGVTLRAWGTKFLSERELSGDVRSVGTEIGRWSTHVETAHFIDWPLVDIQTKDIAEWVAEVRKREIATPHVGGRKRGKVSRSTAKKTLNILSLALDAAVIAGVISSNPAAPVKLKRERRTREPWTYLTLEEQEALETSEAITEADRLIMLFALYTGVRQGEQFNLELPDVVLDHPRPHVVIRYGSKGEPPKNGKIRHVYLSPEAVAVCERWLEVLPTWLAPVPQKRPNKKRNPHRLMFPGQRGGRVQPGKTSLHRGVQVDMPDGTRKQRKVFLLPTYMKAIGVARTFRWHDLRHSCASSLVAGWWGRVWSLEEVKEHLGHSSITITQRYAHLADSAIAAAAAATRRHGGGGNNGAGGPGNGRASSRNGHAVTQRSRGAQAMDMTQDSQGLLIRRSRVRVPVDPPTGNHSGSRHEAPAERDLGRDLRAAATAFLLGASTGKARALAEALWTEVLKAATGLPAEVVRLALDLRAGATAWGPGTATLASLALDAADAATSRSGAAGGGR